MTSSSANESAHDIPLSGSATEVSDTSTEKLKPFVVPERIRRCLTPSRCRSKSKFSGHLERRRRIIQQCQLKAQKTMSEIRTKLINRKQQFHLQRCRLSLQMNRKMNAARERRRRILGERKTRAQNIALLVNEPIITNNLKNEPKESRRKVSDAFEKLVKFIQFHIRRYLLRNYLDYLHQNSVFDKLDTLSYSESLLFVRENSREACVLRSVLSQLVPGVTYQSVLLYGIVLVADIKDSIISHSHSGTNTNTDTSHHDLVSNSITLLLYKVTLSILQALKAIALPGADLRWFSDCRLTLSRLCRQYCELFFTYKNRHLEDCKIIANQASKIMDLAVKSGGISHGDYVKQKVELAKQMNFLAKVETVPTTSRITNDIEAITSTALIRKFPDINCDRLVIVELKHDRPFLEEVSRRVKIDKIVYVLPPCFPSLFWRKFWVKKLQEPEKLVKMNTGRIRIHPETNKVLHYEQLCLNFHVPTLYDHYSHFEGSSQPQLVKQCSHALTRIFTLVVDFVQLFAALDEGQVYGIQQMGYWIASTKTHTSESFANIYAPLILKVSSYSTILADILEKIENFLSKVQPSAQDILHLCHQVELQVMNLWVRHCQFVNLTHFRHFENCLLLMTLNRYLVKMGTNSPELRFPKYCRFLRSYSLKWKVINYGASIRASFAVPDLQKSVPRSKVYHEFYGCWTLFFISGIHKDPVAKLESSGGANEFSVLFGDEILDIQKNVNNTIQTTILTYLCCHYLNKWHKVKSLLPIVSSTLDSQMYDPLMVTSLIPEKLSREVHIKKPLEMSHYLQKEVAKIKAGNSQVYLVIAAKFRQLSVAKSAEHQDLLNRVFDPVRHEVQDLLSQIQHLATTMYDVYHPLLNWIHNDL